MMTIGVLLGGIIVHLSVRYKQGHWLWNDHPDTKRLDAISNGYCVTVDIDNGVKTWICLYDGVRAEGKTIREAIDNMLAWNEVGE